MRTYTINAETDVHIEKGIDTAESKKGNRILIVGNPDRRTDTFEIISMAKRRGPTIDAFGRMFEAEPQLILPKDQSRLPFWVLRKPTEPKGALLLITVPSSGTVLPMFDEALVERGKGTHHLYGMKTILVELTEGSKGIYVRGEKNTAWRLYLNEKGGLECETL